MRVLLLAAILSASAATATAEDPMGPGPFEWRETWLLAQPRFTLSPTSAATLGKGGTLVAVRGDWGNDLGWNQSRAGESPSDRRFLVDGEHRS
ncbi:MAG TPA: hypothetical protein VIC87_13790, partial [Vicinamibacteria bacterium]